MFCECGGMLFVERVEKPPEDLTKQEKLIYNRVCDVKCHDCGKIYYSQPYDYGIKYRVVKQIDK